MTTKRNLPPKLAQHGATLVNALIDLAEDYLIAARLEEALRLLESDIVELLAQELPPEALVRIQIQRAKIMRFKNQLEDSNNDATLELLRETEETTESLGDPRLLAEVVRLIGLVYYDQELWITTLETPQRYFKQALTLRKALGDPRGVAESLHDLGTVYQNRLGRTGEDVERAFAYFQEAYTLAAEGGFIREKAHAARHLGYIYGHHKGEPERALAYHQEFLAGNETLGFKLYLAPAHTMVGFAHYAVDDPEQSLRHFELAQDIAQELGSQHSLAEALFGLGLVAERRDDAGVALEYYERALELAQLINLGPVIQAATNRITELSKGKEQAG